MDVSVTRRWPWLLIAGGMAFALYFAVTDHVLEAREREFYRLRMERFRAETPPVIRCGTPDPPRQPSRVDCYARVVFGAHLVIVGVSVLSGALWKRRGGFARGVWTLLLLCGVVLQLRLGLLVYEARRSPNSETLLWMFAFAPTFILPFIVLSGCVLAKEKAVRPA